MPVRKLLIALKGVLASALTLLLAACDDVSIVVDQTTGEFSPSEYARDAAQGPIPVTVIGGALGVSNERLARAVMDHIQGADWAPHATFTLVSEADAAAAAKMATGGRTYSYVLLFNGPNVTAAALCAYRALPPPTTAPGNDTNIRLVAGLCRNDGIATGVTGRAYRVSGLDDDRFRRLIVGVMQALTMPNQPQINR